MKFTPERCECCGQTKDYRITVDKGTAHIMMAVANAVAKKGENKVHLRNDMECTLSEFDTYHEMIEAGRMTSKMIDNVLRAKYHGLLAQLGNGEYLLTRKGGAFLKGDPVPRVAIVDKKTHTKKGYWNPDEDYTTIKKALQGDPYWEGTLEKVAYVETPLFESVDTEPPVTIVEI